MNNIVALEARQFSEMQLSKWAFLYVLNVAVDNNTTFPAELRITSDADFHVQSMTGSCYGPCNSNGVRSIDASTDFPLAGTLVPSGAGLGAYADRGLMLKISDSGSNRELTSGFVPAETLLSPGYGISKTVEHPFKYWIRKSSTFRFDIRNRDTTAELFHFISITLYGFKYGAPGV